MAKLSAAEAQARELYIPVTEEDHHIRLDYKKFLMPGALQPASDNPDEATYLLAVAKTLENDGVWLHFEPKLVRDPDNLSKFIPDPRAFEVWLSIGRSGREVDSIAPTYRGMVTHDVLLTAGGDYWDRVYQGPVNKTLTAQIASIGFDIEDGLKEHDEWVKRRKEYFRIVSTISDFAGGADFPDISIWDLPQQLLGWASGLQSSQNIRGCVAFLIAATIATRNAANLLANYEDDTGSGAGIVVKVLKVAKKAGDVAQIALTLVDGVGLVRGAASLVGDVNAARLAGGSIVISIGSKGVTAERYVAQYAAENPAAAVKLGKIGLAEDARAAGQSGATEARAAEHAHADTAGSKTKAGGPQTAAATEAKTAEQARPGAVASDATTLTVAEKAAAAEDLGQAVKHAENIRPVNAPELLNHFDAEVDVGEHVERRRRADDSWCLFTKPKCGVRPGSSTNQAVDSTLRNRFPGFSPVRAAEKKTDAALVKRLSKEIGIKIPLDVVEAPWIGRIYGSSGRARSISTSEGFLRDADKFWTQFAKDYPEDYKLISKGRKVTKTLADKWGWDNKFVGDRLIHHHIENSAYVVPVPESLHAGEAGSAIHGTPEILP